MAVAALLVIAIGIAWFYNATHSRRARIAATLTPKQTVEQFYRDLDERRFQQAFALLGPSWKNQLNYAHWKADFADTIAQHATVSTGNDGRYNVSLTAVDSATAGPLTSDFSGSWRVVRGRSGWLLDDPSFAKVSSSYFDAMHISNASVADNYGRVKESLALVVAISDSGIQTGTAFCIASTDSTSYFLTNHHVVGDGSTLRVALASKGSNLYGARVVSVSDDPDAAIIAVDAGGTPSVVLGQSLPREGTNIAVAGYPVVQLELAMHNLGLSPALHTGAVNAVLNDGQYIEYDAQTDHGNSGGPLFDSATGVVYGMVTYVVASPESSAVQDNIAIPVSQLRSFLGQSGVSAAFVPGLGDTAGQEQVP